MDWFKSYGPSFKGFVRISRIESGRAVILGIETQLTICVLMTNIFICQIITIYYEIIIDPRATHLFNFVFFYAKQLNSPNYKNRIFGLLINHSKSISELLKLFITVELLIAL